MQASFDIIACKSIFLNFFNHDSRAWWLRAHMAHVTALDIQVSLSNQMANLGGLSSNVVAC